MNLQDYADKIYQKDGLYFSLDNRDVSYPAEGNQFCFQIEQDSFWFNHRNNCIIEAVKKFCPNSIFFDLGGGNGFVAKGLEDNNIKTVLVEPGIDGALNAKKRGINNVLCSTLEDAGFKLNSIEAIGMFDVVEHIENDHQFIQSVNSYLKKDGLVFITVPAYNFLWSYEDVSAGHYKRYTLRNLNKLLQETGFEPVYSSYIFSFLPLPIFLMRTIPSFFGFNKSKATLEKHQNQHSTNKGFLTPLFDKIEQKELSCISKGKKVPFGGSCFVVARKVVDK